MAIRNAARHVKYSAALTLLLLSLSAAASPPVPPYGCAPAALARLDEELAKYKELRFENVSAGLLEACTMPPSLSDALNKVARAGRDFARSASMSVVADSPLWSRACAGGPRVVLAMGEHLADPAFGPRQRAQTLWAGCGVAALDIATPDEWLRAGPTAELALAAHAWMLDAHLSPSRVRSYTRALAELDAPRKATLAERFASDGMAAGRPPASSVELATRLGHYVGTESLAQRLSRTIQEHRADLAPCFAGHALPRALTLRLVVADGVAQDGELVTVETVGHSATVRHYSSEPGFERCVLARAGRFGFEPFASPTTIEVAIVAPAAAGDADEPMGGMGGVAGGTPLGVTGQGHGTGGATLSVRLISYGLRVDLARQVERELNEQHPFDLCFLFSPRGSPTTTMTVRVAAGRFTVQKIDSRVSAPVSQCLVDAWARRKTEMPESGRLTFRLVDAR